MNFEKSEVNIQRFWVYISGIWGAKSPGRIEPKFFLEEDIPDIITCFKFGDDRFRGSASAGGQILPLPFDFDGRPFNTLTLPCERVMTFEGFGCIFRVYGGQNPLGGLSPNFFWKKISPT